MPQILIDTDFSIGQMPSGVLYEAQRWIEALSVYTIELSANKDILITSTD